MGGALAPVAFSAPGRRCLSTYKLVGKPIWFCGLPSEAGLEARCGEAAKARAKSGKAVRYGSNPAQKAVSAFSPHSFQLRKKRIDAVGVDVIPAPKTGASNHAL